MHPSHAQLAPLAGYTEKEMLEAVKVPQLIMPTSNDPDTYRPGGLTQQILGEKCKIVEFENQQHGFTTRGEGKFLMTRITCTPLFRGQLRPKSKRTVMA